MNNRGFTVLELLIVFTIVLIIAALILPPIQQANNPAERYQQICVDGINATRAPHYAPFPAVHENPES